MTAVGKLRCCLGTPPKQVRRQGSPTGRPRDRRGEKFSGPKLLEYPTKTREAQLKPQSGLLELYVFTPKMRQLAQRELVRSFRYFGRLA